MGHGTTIVCTRTLGHEATTLVRRKWTWAIEDGEPRILADRHVVVEGDTIAAVCKGASPAADVMVDVPSALVLPGFLNLHNHTISSTFFRGLTGDRPRELSAHILFNLIMPLSDLAVEKTEPDHLRAAVELGDEEEIIHKGAAAVRRLQDTAAAWEIIGPGMDRR